MGRAGASCLRQGFGFRSLGFAVTVGFRVQALGLRVYVTCVTKD